MDPCRRARNIVGSITPCSKCRVPYRREESVDLVDASPDVERRVEVVEDPPPSARAVTRFGEVVVKVDGKKIGETRLVAKKGYDKASLGQRVWYTVGGIFA